MNSSKPFKNTRVRRLYIQLLSRSPSILPQPNPTQRLLEQTNTVILSNLATSFKWQIQLASYTNQLPLNQESGKQTHAVNKSQQATRE